MKKTFFLTLAAAIVSLFILGLAGAAREKSIAVESPDKFIDPIPKQLSLIHDGVEYVMRQGMTHYDFVPGNVPSFMNMFEVWVEAIDEKTRNILWKERLPYESLEFKIKDMMISNGKLKLIFIEDDIGWLEINKSGKRNFYFSKWGPSIEHEGITYHVDYKKEDEVVYNNDKNIAYSDHKNVFQKVYVRACKDQELWRKEIYRVALESDKDEDNQWVFVREVKVINDSLQIIDQNGKGYSVSLKH